MSLICLEYRIDRNGKYLPVSEVFKGNTTSIRECAKDLLSKRETQGFNYRSITPKNGEFEALFARNKGGYASKIILKADKSTTLDQESSSAKPTKTPFDYPDLDKDVDISDGRYTVVDGDGHKTFQIWTSNKGPLIGKRVVSVLVGSNNERDYQGFAFLRPRGLSVWNKYKFQTGAKRVVELANFLISQNRAMWVQCGEKYALESGRCWRCHRVITHPESIKNGLGPECYQVVFGGERED